MFTAFEINVTAAAAVAARRAAAWNILFAPEGHAAVPAIARFHLDFSFVYEHNRRARCPAPERLLSAPILFKDTTFPGPPTARQRLLTCNDRPNAHETAARAVVLENDHAADLGE